MDYERAAATSLRLLTAFGKTRTLRTFTAGAYNTATSAVAAPTSVDESRQTVLLDFSRESAGQALREGSFVKTGDRRCLLSPSGAVPALDSRIVDGTTVYSVIDIKTISPAGVVVLYDLVIRK